MTDLSMILAKDANGKYRMWACRGKSKGCARNQFRKRKAPCDDCFGPLDESLTLEQVIDRMAKGDA